jgi:hypothetical protein
MLAPTFEEHCLQPQQEVTEWINMYCDIFQNFVDTHQDGLWQHIKEYWINVNQNGE